MLLAIRGKGYVMRKHQATITRTGQVTIPVELRRALGLADGGPVEVA